MKERDATTTCKRDHHLCSQTLICAPRCVESPTILKLERQEAWWDGFVNATGVDRSGLVGESWRGFSRGPAFYERPSAAGRATVLSVLHLLESEFGAALAARGMTELFLGSGDNTRELRCVVPEVSSYFIFKSK